MATSSSSSNSKRKLTTTPGKVNVRYDASHSKWAIVNENGNPVEYLDRGVMTDVTFETLETKTVVGCGAHTDHIGVANGVLKIGATSRATGLRNLDFKGKDGFVCPEGTELTTAKILVLNPDRRAVYKK